MKNVLIILFVHFVADFIFQTDKQAINKSTSNMWLLSHVATYAFGLLVCGFIIFESTVTVLQWTLYNALFHYLQDWCTSRINSHLYKTNQRHWFFVGIGADQFIHYLLLLSTYEYLK